MYNEFMSSFFQSRDCHRLVAHYWKGQPKEGYNMVLHS